MFLTSRCDDPLVWFSVVALLKKNGVRARWVNNTVELDTNSTKLVENAVEKAHKEYIELCERYSSAIGARNHRPRYSTAERQKLFEETGCAMFAPWVKHTGDICSPIPASNGNVLYVTSSPTTEEVLSSLIGGAGYRTVSNSEALNVCFRGQGDTETYPALRVLALCGAMYLLPLASTGATVKNNGKKIVLPTPDFWVDFETLDHIVSCDTWAGDSITLHHNGEKAIKYGLDMKQNCM